jgi:hypothetical protein
MGACNPVYVDWLLAQRRGLVGKNEPLLSINAPTGDAVYVTGATNVSLAGGAEAAGQAVTRVAWENQANRRTGIASGTNVWCTTDIPLVANRTNLIIVTATTTSWAPALRGSTTFNDTLTVFSLPIHVTLALQAQSATLNWTGGAGPYSVQCATDLNQGDWTTIVSNAMPPVTVTLGNGPEFFRVAGQ